MSKPVAPITLWVKETLQEDHWLKLSADDVAIPPRTDIEDRIAAVRYAMDAISNTFSEVSMQFELTFRQFRDLWALLKGRLPARKRRYLRMMARGRGEPAELIK